MRVEKHLALLLNLTFATMAVAIGTNPEGSAPKNGQITGSWSSGNKQFFGTSFEAYDRKLQYSDESPTAPISKVWFTGAEGVLTEVYWPTIDNPQVRDSQFLITDGKTRFWEERRDLIHKVEWLEVGVPVIQITNREKNGAFEIKKIIFSDPRRNTVFTVVRITRNEAGLKFYYLHKPSVANTPMGNNALVGLGKDQQVPEAFFAWQGEQAQSLVMTLPWKMASAGFVGVSDGYTDVKKDFQMDFRYREAIGGNVAMQAWLEIPEEIGQTDFVIGLGFATDLAKAYNTTVDSLLDAKNALQTFVGEWRAYQKAVRPLDSQGGDGGKLYRASISTLKSMEDKTWVGAFVASPSIPWGQYREDHNANSRGMEGSRSHLTGGYHLVWARDLVQMATTFMAAGDAASALASLHYLINIQYRENSGTWSFGTRQIAKSGHFPQNAWINGEAYWDSLQMDQSALPVSLAYLLWKEGILSLPSYWEFIKRSADAIATVGPWSAQERWEENFGASPNTIAAQISALWVASEMADSMGDRERKERYRHIADQWSSKPGDRLEDWTFTQRGRFGNGRYYQRVEGARHTDQIWNPNDAILFNIANNGGLLPEKDVLDGGFLSLVRYGVRSAKHWATRDTLEEYDGTLSTKRGEHVGYIRYTGDRYNYDETNGKQTAGMLWPFLTGERSFYEYIYRLESGNSLEESKLALAQGLKTMEFFATPSLMLPEQVWDDADRFGQATGAATPLGWTHGEYVKLLRAREDGYMPDRLPQNWVKHANDIEK